MWSFMPYDRIGENYISIDPKKIVGVIESNIPEEARAFKEVDEFTSAIGNHLANFLVDDMKAGRIPKQFLPIQRCHGQRRAGRIGIQSAHSTLQRLQ